jgi:hypothetical protein
MQLVLGGGVETQEPHICVFDETLEKVLIESGMPQE